MAYPTSPFALESVVLCRPLHTRAARAAVAICAIGLSACSDSPVADPRFISSGVEPQFAKPATGPTVSSASPAFGDQGVTVDVHVLGSGFTAGAQATWLLHGAADAHVHTNRTTVVSSTELVANITIASDAPLDFWDVQVALAGGKNGVGSEVFEVTAAQILGSGTPGGDAWVFGVSESGAQVSGYANSAWVFDEAGGMIDLGDGQAMAVDPLGTLVAGKNGAGMPTVWIKQSPRNWVPQQLPLAISPIGRGGRVQGAARAADGTLLLTGFDTWAASTRPSAPTQNRVALWSRDQTGQWHEEAYVLPQGASAGAGKAVNPLGQIAGQYDGNTGAIWDDPATVTVLDGLPNAISADGRLAVGFKWVGNSVVAAYWWRDRGTQQWHTVGVQLPSLAGPQCPDGRASGVNSAGFIVGASCPTGKRKNQATVWHLDLTGPVPVLSGTPFGLSGLGGVDGGRANAITEGAPYWVSGFAPSNPSQLAVRWRLSP